MNTPQGIRDYLTLVVQRGGSDLHLTVNAPPAARVNGTLQALEDFHLHADQVRELIIGTMNETQRARLDDEWELDYAIESIRGSSGGTSTSAAGTWRPFTVTSRPKSRIFPPLDITQ